MSRMQSFARAFGLGLIGVVALVLIAVPPEGIPRILLAVNPLILLALLGFLGAWSAPKLGLRSALILGDSIETTPLLRAFGLTILIGAAISLGDFLTQDYWLPEGVERTESLSDAVSLQGLLFGVTYGGITEEVMMRFGLMSGIMLALSRFLSRKTAANGAIIFAALLFAAGHLPAVLASGLALEPAMLLRVLVLNSVLGIWFGWLYYRHNLETAITAHAGFHVGAFLLGTLWG